MMFVNLKFLVDIYFADQNSDWPEFSTVVLNNIKVCIKTLLGIRIPPNLIRVMTIGYSLEKKPLSGKISWHQQTKFPIFCLIFDYYSLITVINISHDKTLNMLKDYHYGKSVFWNKSWSAGLLYHGFWIKVESVCVNVYRSRHLSPREELSIIKLSSQLLVKFLSHSLLCLSSFHVGGFWIGNVAQWFKFV